MSTLDTRLRAMAVRAAEKFDELDARVAALPGAFTPQAYGAVADGVTDDGAAFIAAIAALKAYALNTSGGGFYKGSPKLFIPAGNYYLGAHTLDINHSLVIEGEGCGSFGPGAGGCTHLRWAAATDGIRIQFPLTSGNTTVDGVTHDGAGGVVLRDIMLEGGFDGTNESDHHGIVIRSAIKAENLYIRNFPGEGVKAWAGTVTGFGAVSGNVSTTRLTSVKCEGNRGGFDIRGTDSNVVLLDNCEGYLNRQWGYLDDNGAGANTVIGMHGATNGQVTGPWPQTQCSYSGNRYALVWGGDPTAAPSGTTADTVNWYYMGVGGVASSIPAWTATPNTFRAGGDYLTLGSAGVLISQCYSEGGGFSQFNGTTLITHSAIGDDMSRGGQRIIPQNSGLLIRTINLHLEAPAGLAATGGALACKGFTHTLGDNASSTSSDFTLNLDATTASSKVNFRTAGGTVVAYIDAEASNGLYINAPSANGIVLRVGGTASASIISGGLDLWTGKVLSVNGTQVVGARQTGTAANASDLATAITLVNDLKTKLVAHGLIS